MPEEDKISEWNEANLKMKRLHDAQERINFCKRDPKGITDGKFNYEWWIKDVDVLFGEGKQKYSPKEKTQVDRIKKILFDKLILNPPHTKITANFIGGNQSGFVIDDKAYRDLLNLVEEFEEQVKELNDKHGLSTKNRGTSGLF